MNFKENSMGSIHFVSGLKGAGKSLLSMILADYLKSQGRIVEVVDSSMQPRLGISNSSIRYQKINIDISLTSDIYALDFLLELLQKTDDIIVELQESAESVLLNWLENSIAQYLNSDTVYYWFISDLSCTSWNHHSQLRQAWNQLDLKPHQLVVLNEYHQVESGAFPPDTRAICAAAGIKLLHLPACEVALRIDFTLAEIIQHSALTDRAKIIDWQQSAIMAVHKSGVLPHPKTITDTHQLLKILPQSSTASRLLTDPKKSIASIPPKIDDAPWI
jgi:hypothetical protein